MTESPGDSLARDVRKYVFDHFLEYAVPPVLEQIMERYHLERPDAFAVLKALEEAPSLRETDLDRTRGWEVARIASTARGLSRAPRIAMVE